MSEQRRGRLRPTAGRRGLPRAGPDPAKWRWFATWVITGAMAGGALAAAFAGLVMLPFAGVLALLLTRSEAPRRGIPGLVVGGGLDALAVAYVNRRGPGEVCTFTASGSACIDDFNPLPWLAGGLVLVIAGLAVFMHNRRYGAARGD